MTSASFLKSKAFKEREENVREKLRQASKQDLLADLSRWCKFNVQTKLSIFSVKSKCKVFFIDAI